MWSWSDGRGRSGVLKLEKLKEVRRLSRDLEISEIMIEVNMDCALTIQSGVARESLRVSVQYPWCRKPFAAVMLLLPLRGTSWGISSMSMQSH